MVIREQNWLYIQCLLDENSFIVKSEDYYHQKVLPKWENLWQVWALTEAWGFNQK